MEKLDVLFKLKKGKSCTCGKQSDMFNEMALKYFKNGFANSIERFMVDDLAMGKGSHGLVGII